MQNPWGVKKSKTLIGCLFFTILGLGVFCQGFFAASPGVAGYSDVHPQSETQFTKLALVIVDAMRSDFLFSQNSHFSNVHSLIEQGNAYPLTAHSSPPTVTLPRLKGITSGAAPSFLDAVLNIAESDSSAMNFDSWVVQAKRAGKKMCLFGDDTWLNLFPNTFDKSDGTSSFYVADYTEVDNNVTRHLSNELNNWDCDVLILHYLGLDHIGHKAGPHSPLMPKKQLEMDSVFKRVYEASDEDTLLVLAGDHGMNDVGNHGGSSIGETSAALLFASKRFQFEEMKSPVEEDSPFNFYSRVQQTDLVPTIAGLLGLPIPKNSIGLPILDLWPSDQRSTVLDQVCQHFKTRFDFQGECNLPEMRAFQETISSSSESYDLHYMSFGLGVMGLAALALLSVVAFSGLSALEYALWAFTAVLYIVCMFGSSTVEEEHQFWFWGSILIIMAIFCSSDLGLSNALAFLLAVKILRVWTRPGQKWLEGGDLTQILTTYPALMYALIVLTFFVFMWDNRKNPLNLLGGVGFLVHRVSWLYYGGGYVPELLKPLIVPEHLIVHIAQAIFTIAFLGFLIAIVSRKNTSKGWLALLLLVQVKTSNVPLILLFNIIETCIKNVYAEYSQRNSTLLGLLRLYLQYISFFAMGGSNSLATIDLSLAYNGLSSYNIPLVGVLTFLSNWAGPIYWSIAIPYRRNEVAPSVAFYSCFTFALCLACYILRSHLFIWTVFSPKLLYVSAWLILQFVLVDCVARPLLAH